MEKRGKAELAIVLVIALLALAGLFWSASPSGEVALRVPLKPINVPHYGISFAPRVAGNYSCWCPRGSCLVTDCMTEPQAAKKCGKQLKFAWQLCNCNRLTNPLLVATKATVSCL
jgi:hypothetical protein